MDWGALPRQRCPRDLFLVAQVVRVRVRRLKGAALAVVRVLAVATAIALIMLLVAVLGGLILLAVDELFN